MASKLWLPEEKNFVRKNIHLSNAELAIKLGKTQAAVENQVRALGLARTFQPHEVDKLYKVWGKNRKTIERALPRFTWRQISKKAQRLGLPSLKDVRLVVNLYEIARHLGCSSAIVTKWLDAGLQVENDRGKHFKHNIWYVDIDTFWYFAVANPTLVDIARIPEDVLGAPPLDLVDAVCASRPHKPRKKRLTALEKRELVVTYFGTETPVEIIAERFNVTVDTVRTIASKHRQEGQSRSKARVLTTEFIKRVAELYYKEQLSIKECATALNCSKSSIYRALSILHKKKGNGES